MNLIKVQLNEEKRAIVKLYGKEFDVTDSLDKKGQGRLKAFGEAYQIQLVKAIKKVKFVVNDKKVK